jgi:ATP-binding cassette subfamily A (ABC1) protein 5
MKLNKAEALSDRLGIMVKGKLKCLGSSQYLKQKFGSGYTLEVRTNEEKRSDLVFLIEKLFNKQAIMSECFSNRFTFDIPRHSIESFANIFNILEKGKLFNSCGICF